MAVSVATRIVEGNNKSVILQPYRNIYQGLQIIQLKQIVDSTKSDFAYFCFILHCRNGASAVITPLLSYIRQNMFSVSFECMFV